jgi:hypothetical protein
VRAERAAADFDIGLTTFLTWVKEGKMPKPVRVGGAALYSVKALEAAWERLSGEGEPLIEP